MILLGDIELKCPAVMGVLNVTPDSFSDGGRFATLDAALRRAEAMAAEGAAIIDVGGESTRPGAESITVAEEIERTIPIIEAIVARVDVPISIDTHNAEVMRAAAVAGARMINDVCALQTDGAMEAAVALQQPVCLMHMQGRPHTMQHNPHYDDVVVEVTEFLARRVTECVAAGLPADLIVVDPGFGFGKTARDNIELLANLRQLQDIGRPVLVGLSRKATLGALTGRDVESRLPASVAAAVLAVMQGASIVRAHDVAATVDALAVVGAVIELDNSR